MKKLLLLLTSVVAVSACQNSSSQNMDPKESMTKNMRTARVAGKLNVSSYAGLSRSDQKSKLTVTLKTVDGQIVEKVATLKPNTLYKLDLVSLGADQIELRSCFGFEVLEKVISEGQDQVFTTYTIRTESDVTEPLFVSFLPLRGNGRSMSREIPQNFFLAKN